MNHTDAEIREILDEIHLWKICDRFMGYVMVAFLVICLAIIIAGICRVL